ncbi:MAG TPA: hypothetical protein VKZ84_06460 [Bacteriovoracaceae bacterium]|nr:hypothetical protein [Bacteriovoracaceae bacterium]
MKILISISLFFLVLGKAYSCELITKKIISLSGPVSTYLDQLGIIDQVEGISFYHPIEKFKGTRFPGGVYLSTATLRTFEGKVVFFDKSRELKKVLNRFPKVKAIEVDSRRKTPREVIELTESLLAPYLKECTKQKVELKERVARLEEDIKKNISKIKQSVFFLGKISTKIPETVLSNDGFVYWLKKEKLLESYPSDLEYLNFSMKIVSALRGKFNFFGLQDSYDGGEKSIEKVSDKNFNVKYPGALTPGYTQLEFLKYLLNYF